MALLLAPIFLSSCVRYHARPIEPPQLEQEYRARSLNDPGLRAFVAQQPGGKLAQWPPSIFDLDVLISIALYYSPELDLVRARVQSAEAAVVTARSRINPSLSVGAGYERSPESAFLFHFDPTLTLVTAGKRGYRILQAQMQAEAAQLELAESAWALRSRLRTGMIDYLHAQHSLESLRQEQRLRQEKVSILEKRLDVGELSRPELESARIELTYTEAAIRSSEGAASTSLAVLAATAGMPASTLSNVRFAWPAPEMPPQESNGHFERMQKAGLLNRLDVRRSLLEYAATEAALQLEVARQYPDIELTPGYSFDEGHHKFMVGPGIPLPFPNRNQGPIAEAASRRVEAEVRFTVVQAQAIAEIEKAARAYRAAVAELAHAERMNAMQQDQGRMILRAHQLGEADRLALTAARIESAATAKIRLEAFRKVQLACGAVEDAIQQPLQPGALRHDISPAFPRKNPGKEGKP